MLRAILNKSWRQHPIKQQLYSHLPPITKTIKVRRTRYAGYCWRSRDELISDVLLWTPAHGRATARWPARTYIQQLCEDTGCSSKDLVARQDDEICRERKYSTWLPHRKHPANLHSRQEFIKKIYIFEINKCLKIKFEQYIRYKQLKKISLWDHPTPQPRTECNTKPVLTRSTAAFNSKLPFF